MTSTQIPAIAMTVNADVASASGRRSGWGRGWPRLRSTPAAVETTLTEAIGRATTRKPGGFGPVSRPGTVRTTEDVDTLVAATDRW
jgi:hypothetical protein